jgi:hypothetical protein
MNPYKLRAIVDHVRARGRLPTDDFGQILSPADLLVWYELERAVDVEEQREVKRELVLLTEAQELADRLRRKVA